MITKIVVKNQPVFINAEMEPLKVNYIFGGNGTGKTTLTKILRNPENYSDCNIKMNTTECETFVYNKDFVEENFSNNNSLRGIFSIGEENKHIEETINKKIEIKKLYDEKILNKQNTITKLTEELNSLKYSFEESCWVAKKAMDSFKNCLIGVRDSKQNFADKCLKLHDENKRNLNELDILSKKYNLIYSNNLDLINTINKINYENFIRIEQDLIFKTLIVPQNTGVLNKLIENLHNSDWVNQGVVYIDNEHNLCPFCQQSLNNKLKQDIKNVFNNIYEIKYNELLEKNNMYQTHFKEIINNLENIIKLDYENFNLKDIKSHFHEIKETCSNNLKNIDKKLNSPAIMVDIKSIMPNLVVINEEIERLNNEIINHNNLVQNQDIEAQKLNEEVWLYITNKLLSQQISDFKKKRDGLNSGILTISKQLDAMKLERYGIENQITELQSKTSNIDHAINEINKLLIGFSFTNFKIRKAEDNRNYEIVRLDGTNVGDTLSEGEQRFITFLYFYQLIKGNVENKRTIKNKIIVIDDPISSLDSNILFIVSTLVKAIINDCLNGNYLIEQVFVLTHNIYFHQEISFKGLRDNISVTKEKFWIIKKINNSSKFIGSQENKIKTSYQLLWQEIKNPSLVNNSTIFNTLRRILEYYFKIIGDINYEACIDGMDGENKFICKALLSFINDGSHTINDDFVISYDFDDITKYLSVFEKVFRITEQGAHYDMMMK